jgi:hypothetical protein
MLQLQHRRELMRKFAIAAAFFLVAAKGFSPTRNGDVIGSANMLPDKSIAISLRSVGCDGTIAETEFVVLSSDPRYPTTISQYDIHAPGDVKKIVAVGSEECRR